MGNSATKDDILEGKRQPGFLLEKIKIHHSERIQPKSNVGVGTKTNMDRLIQETLQPRIAMRLAASRERRAESREPYGRRG